MMKDDDVRLLMSRQLDHDLNEEEQQQLQELLQDNEQYRQEFEHMRHISDQLDQLPKVNPPHSIVDRMQPEFAKIDRQKAFENVIPKKKSVWASALGLAAAAIFIIWVLNSQLSPPSMDQAGIESSGEENFAMESTPMEQPEVGMDATDDSMTMMVEEEATESTEDPVKDKTDPETESGQVASEQPEQEIRALGEPDEIYPSPLLTFTAYLGYAQDDIRIDQDGSPYYLSSNPKIPWVVEHIEWVSDYELYYEVYHPRQDRTEYWIIDLEERTETELEEPHPDRSDNPPAPVKPGEETLQDADAQSGQESTSGEEKTDDQQKTEDESDDQAEVNNGQEEQNESEAEKE